MGLVLGPILEDAFRQSLIISKGSFLIFVERPISGGFLLVTALVLASKLSQPFISRFRKGRDPDIPV
jgi:putative tricarboxylic transport membrane protein